MNTSLYKSIAVDGAHSLREEVVRVPSHEACFRLKFPGSEVPAREENRFVCVHASLCV